MCCYLNNFDAVSMGKNFNSTRAILDTINLQEFIIDQNEIEQEENTNQEFIEQTPSLLQSSKNPYLSIILSKGFNFNLRYQGLPNALNEIAFQNISLNSLNNKRITILAIYDNILNYSSQFFHSFQPSHPYQLGTPAQLNVLDLNVLALQSGWHQYVQYSNRNFQYLYGSDFISKRYKNDSRFLVSSKIRWANDGAILAGFSRRASLLAAYHKQWQLQQELLVQVLFTYSHNSSRTSVTQEAVDISNNHYYNPNWGFYNGGLKFVNTQKAINPTLILNYNHHAFKKGHLNLGFLYNYNQTIQQNLDWHDAADPKADYYKNLPSNQSDSLIKNQVYSNFINNPLLLYFNWEKLYQINRQNYSYLYDNQQLVKSGNISNYILRHLYNNQHSMQLAGSFNRWYYNRLYLATGIQVQGEWNHYFQKLADLLGGSFYINWNFYADPTFNPQAIQFNLLQPNTIIYENQKYGPNYAVNFYQAKYYWQIQYLFHKFIFNLGSTHTSFSMVRMGYNQNGLFPENSLGSSGLKTLGAHSVKMSVQYKFLPNLQFLLSGYYSQQIPTIQNYFLDISWHNKILQNFQFTQYQGIMLDIQYKNEKTQAFGQLYLVQSHNETIKNNFFNDKYNNFVIGVLSNVQKNYLGFSFGNVLTLTEQWSLKFAGSISQHVYGNNPRYSLFLKNDLKRIEDGMSLLNSFPVELSPAWSAFCQIICKPNAHWYCNLSIGSAFQSYSNYNPYRRTPLVLQDINPKSTTYSQILSPLQLSNLYQIDLSVYYNNRIKISSKTYHVISAFVSCYNLTNNIHIVSYQYEQLRYNYDDNNIATFSPKLLYAQGISFTIGFKYSIN